MCLIAPIQCLVDTALAENALPNPRCIGALWKIGIWSFDQGEELIFQQISATGVAVKSHRSYCCRDRLQPCCLIDPAGVRQGEACSARLAVQGCRHPHLGDVRQP